MGIYFEDIHSMPCNELEGIPHTLADTAEVRALRGADSYYGFMALGKALCRQLRYREAIEAYSQAIALNKQDPEAYRERAARYIATLQPEKAAADLEFCLPLSFAPEDTLYRLGIARYLAGDYAGAAEAEAQAFARFDDEMGIASMFWHTLSAFRAGLEPVLLAAYREDMDVGHHTAYRFAVRLAAGLLSLPEALETAVAESEDLEYSMMAYGIASYALYTGETEICRNLLADIVRRDGFWISYGYLAAWRDLNRDTGRM